MKTYNITRTVEETFQIEANNKKEAHLKLMTYTGDPCTVVVVKKDKIKLSKQQKP
jgi:GTP-binding protein EngB required for normal cell division